MTKSRAWYCCARINRTDKSYFAHQIDGFEALNPLVVTWDDGRPETERGDSVVIRHPWNRNLPIRGGHKFSRALLHVKAMVSDNPFAASGAEKTEMMQIAQQTPPSLLYCHTGFVALRMMPVAKAFDVPLVVHSHGLDINIRDDLHQRVFKRHLPQIDRAVVVARWMIPWFVENGYDPDKIIVSPMGVPLSQEVPASGQRADPPYFVFIGRFVRYKGIDRAIRAFAAVYAKHPHARFKIVGDGPIKAELQMLADSLGLNDAVEFTGSLPAAETMRAITQSCAMVHHAMDEPDGPEAFPTVVSEAMALCKPVIGTRCGGIPDQVVDGETGYLIDQNDIETMAQRMEQVLIDPKLATRLGQAGRQRAEKHFNSVRLAREMETRLLAL